MLFVFNSSMGGGLKGVCTRDTGALIIQGGANNVYIKNLAIYIGASNIYIGGG